VFDVRPGILSAVFIMALLLGACEERRTFLPRPPVVPSLGEIDPECHGKLGAVTETREQSWPPPCYRPDYGTGYKITFDQFQQLIAYPPYQASTGALLRDWYGYEIAGTEDLASVRSAAGEIVNLHALHETIQSDPQKQYYLYQSAMALWR
jgi:hypothetical protein